MAGTDAILLLVALMFGVLVSLILLGSALFAAWHHEPAPWRTVIDLRPGGLLDR